MQPALAPVDLRVPSAQLPDLPLMEDISPPPQSHLASALASLEDSASSVPSPRDPLEGSGLSGFGLLAVWSVLLT